MIKETEKTMTDTTATTIPVEPGRMFAFLALEGSDETGRAEWHGGVYRWVLATRLGAGPVLLGNDGTAEPADQVLRNELAVLRNMKRYASIRWTAGIAQLWLTERPVDLDHVDDLSRFIDLESIYEIPVSELDAPKSRVTVLR